MPLPHQVFLELVRRGELLPAQLAETHLPLHGDCDLVELRLHVAVEPVDVGALHPADAAPEGPLLRRRRLVVDQHLVDGVFQS